MPDKQPDNDHYYKKLGLQCGLEVHQQLQTEKKLFCRCKTTLRNDKPTSTILRHMRPTLSELGEYDGTALMEFKTKKNVIYQLYDDTVCTYEMDDTPPFRLNQQALNISIEIALLHNCSIVDEIHISRKQYLDGSIPTGFQRTGIIGIEGWIPYNNKKIRIIQLALEEDACREISDKGHTIIFKTDRLSIPLVEVVTYPDIQTPTEATEVANLIGRILRSTGHVRRGLGSIRQDVNVSIKGGTRIELKGVPKLQYIAKAVATEAQRQKALLNIKDQLRLRGITKETFHSETHNVTKLFKKTKCTQLKTAIKNNGEIHGILLRSFACIFDTATQPNKTFADEIAGRVRVIACQDTMPNIIYSKQFKAFGLNQKEITQLKQRFNPKSIDTIVLTWGEPTDVQTALEEIKIRAIEATQGIPPETRQVFSDGTNDFERILPGPNRMYPDTDSPPTPIQEKQLNYIKKSLPERIWDTEKKLQKLGLPKPLIKSLSISSKLTIFNTIIKNLDVPPILVAVTLQETMKHLHRQGKHTEKISDEQIYHLFESLTKNNYSKEALPNILAYLADNPDATVQKAQTELHIKPMSEKDVQKVINDVLTKHINHNKLNRPFNTLMGEVMQATRNKIDGKKVAELLTKTIKNYTEKKT